MDWWFPLTRYADDATLVSAVKILNVDTTSLEKNGF
ncbi:MAG: hypothetical protein ACI9JM_001726 [Halioglobus sp.]|jgi:hypothetical protein